MVYMPCYDNNKNDYMIHICDIFVIGQHDNKKETLSVKTSTGEFILYFRGSLETARKFFTQFGFRALNSGAVCNIDRLVFYDKESNLAFFSRDIFVSVSRQYKSKVYHLPPPSS